MKGKKEKELLVEQLKKTPVVEVAVQKAGVARSSFYRWKKEDPEFAKSADEALAEGLLLMNDLAESQLLSAIRDKNLSGIIFWLKHRHEAYGTKVELSGRITHQREPLTPEQEDLIREALRLAMPRGDLNEKNHGSETPENN